jgi:hypothetical protein
MRAARLFSALLLALTAWLFAENVHRYYFLGDDAFISFRYANHLVQGTGLVWNPGERVEGYTNFLWVLLMALSIRLGLEPELVSNAIGIASGLGVIAALVVFSARITSWRNPFVWVAPLVLATSRSFTAWCTGGLETMFFTLLVFLAYLTFLRERATRAPRPLGSSLLFALATLTRPEGMLFMAVAGLFYAGEILLKRRSFRSALIWCSPYIAAVGVHFLWRHAYYGYWLPNTFYAKVPGAWWDHGAKYLALFANDYQILWFLPLLLPVLLLRRQLATGLFCAATAAYLIYVAYIGGDRFEFRFLDVVFPYFYGLLADSLYQIAQLGARRLRFATSALAVAIGAALVVTTHVGSRRPEAVRLRYGITSVQAAGQYGAWRVEEGVFLRRLIDEEILPADLVLCVTGAGAIPYYTDWPTVDSLGLNDVTIARLPLEDRGVIAHEREAPYEYLVERKVVIFDVLNRLVHRTDRKKREKQHVIYDGRELPLKAVRARGRYLIFATLLTDEELEKTLAPLEILH